MALVMSPEYLMPPSAISGTPPARVAREHSAIAVICGTPAPLHHARGADRARPDPDLNAIHAQRDQFLRAFVSRHVAGDQLHFGELALDGLHRAQYSAAVAVRGIDGEHVHLAADQFLRALQEIAGRADGRAHAQPALLSLAELGYFNFF